MTTEPPRRGRRDNGLDASAFVPLADVDPRVGEHLLDVLRLAGVPAYLEPSADVEPYTRALALPSPPTDRLWVDREQRGAAQEIVAAEVVPQTPAPGDDRPSRGLANVDEERAWREIVDGFGTEPDSPVGRWPAGEDTDPPKADAEPKERDPEPADPQPRRDWFNDADVQVGPEDADSDEGHYEPPPPPPVPRLSRHTILAVVLICVGALLLIAPGTIGMDSGTGLTLGVFAVVGAAGMLVWRLGERSSDDGPDDGAVV